MLSQKVVGQPNATRVIVPYIQMFQAGLAPEGRPVGVFLLLGPTGTGKNQNRGSAGRSAARLGQEHPESGLRRVPDGTRGRQADRRASRISGASRNAAHAHAAEAERGHQRKLRALAGAVRRNREGRALHDAPAAGRARQGRAAAGRQLHRQFRKEPGISHQQPGRARNDARDQSGFRIPVGSASANRADLTGSCRTSRWWRCASASRRSSSTASMP